MIIERLKGFWCDDLELEHRQVTVRNAIEQIERLRAEIDRALCERLIRERKEAADEITRLRAENETLRAALKPFADKAVEADKPYAPDITEDYWLWRAALAAIRESE